MIARGLAEQTRGTGVTVNSILPGPTRSEGIVEFIRSVVDKDAPEAEREAEFFTKLRALLASLGAITNGAAVRVEGGIIPTTA